MTKKTLDGMAVEMMLKGYTKGVERLAQKAGDYLECKVVCPYCGDYGPHEHNMDDVDPTWLCTGCWEQFEDEGITL